MAFQIDDGEFPLVTVKVVGGSTPADTASYLQHMESLIARARSTGERAVHVIDAREALLSSASDRRMMGEWMKEHDLDNRETCGGFAFVFDSAIVRGALTAVLWIHPLPAPHFITSDVGEALSWARQRLSQAGPVGEPTRATG